MWELKPGAAREWVQAMKNAQLGQPETFAPARPQSVDITSLRARFPSGSSSKGQMSRDLREDNEPSDVYALLCFKVGKHTIRLVQSDMSHTYNDEDLFRKLRHKYQGISGSLIESVWSPKRWPLRVIYWMRLTSLKHIEFRKVRTGFQWDS